MLSMQEVNVLGQIFDTTWGRSSTARTGSPTQSRRDAQTDGSGATRARVKLVAFRLRFHAGSVATTSDVRWPKAAACRPRPLVRTNGRIGRAVGSLGGMRSLPGQPATSFTLRV